MKKKTKQKNNSNGNEDNNIVDITLSASAVKNADCTSTEE